ncbi:MAG: DUF58 domain-containing protein [Planctomycetota bacterium]
MVAWNRTAVDARAAALCLCLDPRRRRHGAGDRLGAGAGASVEFHDHRAYMPGDDLRHLDWNVLARSDQLVLRRYRQEVAPRVEVLLDTSASMALTPQKMELAATLAALFTTLAQRAGDRVRLFAAGDAWRPLVGGGRGDWRPVLGDQPCAGAGGLATAPTPRLAPAGERILVSDGLCREGGPAVVRRLGAEAGSICLVQVLSREERDPSVTGLLRLEDPEGGAADRVVDAAAIAAYRERLDRHQAGWQQALAGRGIGLVTLRAEDGLEAAVAALVRRGLVRPEVGR